MRSLISIPVILLAFSLCLPMVSSDAEAGSSAGGVSLCRVCPAYPGEFLTIMNDGDAVDLRGWKFTDGEGSIILDISMMLLPGGVLSWCESAERFSSLYPGEASFCKNTTGIILEGNFKMADKGDEVMLYDADGTLIDVVYYGETEPSYPWTGPPLSFKKNTMLVRDGLGIEYGAWDVQAPGVFTTISPTISGKVTPILYPEGALETTVRQVDLSEKSIEMAVYLLENWTLARHLSMAEARGVDVTILLEGQPVGGISENGAALAYYLLDAGAEVWVMRSSDSFRRYDYLHAKYMIFDGERLMVSSENMADTSYGSNRGWGLLVESRTLSERAKEIFDTDMAGKGLDIFPLELSIPRQEGRAGRSMTYDTEVPESFNAAVSLATSPFGIEETIVRMVDGADERLLVQQLNVDESWLEGGSVMGSVFRAAERGVEVRILLDAGMGTEESNLEVAEALNGMALQKGWDLECRMSSDGSPFGRLHNKGVVTDSSVLVGSANWVDNSMLRNREMALLVTSSAVSDIFAEWFMDDWKGDSTPPVISLPWTYLEIRSGTMFTIDATQCSDPSGISSFSWDLDGDGIEDLIGPVHTISMPAGMHNITLTVTDVLGNQADAIITVNVTQANDTPYQLLIYAPLPLLALFLALMRLKRRI